MLKASAVSGVTEAASSGIEVVIEAKLPVIGVEATKTSLKVTPLT